MKARELMHTTPDGEAVTRDRSQAFRLFAVAFAVAAALAIVLGAMLSGAQAAPGAKITQHKIPTDNSAPKHITKGSDGNLWFTEGNPAFDEATFTETGKVGRITLSGDVTEFALCEFCSPNDIVQGPSNVLYLTTNNAGLSRITTDGVVQADLVPHNGRGSQIFSANGNGIAANGNDVWYADFNNSTIYRYSVTSEEFTRYKVPTSPTDVAVNAAGIVWYTTTNNVIGKLDPQSGTVVGNDPATGQPTAATGSVVGASTETPVPARATQIAIATDGKVWYTERFNHHIGRLDPSDNQVTRFPTLTPDAGPQDITAASDGSLWFTQANLGNIAQITPDGTITEEGKAVKDDPNSGLENAFGIAIGPDEQSVWFTMQADNKIAALEPPKQK